MVLFEVCFESLRTLWQHLFQVMHIVILLFCLVFFFIAALAYNEGLVYLF